MTQHDIRSAVRPDPDQPMVDIADYVVDYTIDSQGSVRHRALHAARFARLRDAGDEISRIASSIWARWCPARPCRAARACRARVSNSIRCRPRLQHRHAGALAGFQRHLARGGVGPSVGQSRHDPRRWRLPVAQGRARRRQAADRARCADLGDQGARDPGLLCAEEFVQSRRPRSRDPGAAGLDRGGDRDARRRQGRNHHCRFAQLDRQRRAAHLSPCAEHRTAQELGGRRRLPARGDARAECGRQARASAIRRR